LLLEDGPVGLVVEDDHVGGPERPVLGEVEALTGEIPLAVGTLDLGV
jgi:hypothetical protein